MADIGTDHAALPIFLVSQGISPWAIAVEKACAPFQRAREAVRRSGWGGQVEVRFGDGLEPLKPRDRVHTVVIAGLGGDTTCSLLEQGREKLSFINRLVLQPMKDTSLVRRWLGENGLGITGEKLARERGRFYEIIAAEKGCPSAEDPFSIEFGPCLMGSEDPLLLEYLDYRIRRCERIINHLLRSSRPGIQKRKRYYRQQKQKLEEVRSRVMGRHIGNYTDGR